MAREPRISAGPVPTEGGLPACPVGVDLLRRFKEARANDYAFLQVQDFVDLSTSAFDGIPEWDAFTEHCGTCEDCREWRAALAERSTGVPNRAPLHRDPAC
jgi:hypothetical protein